MAPISTVSENWSELPIRQRGLFLNDHFFRDSREHFQEALDKVLHDWEDQELSNWQHSSKLSNWDEDIVSDRLKRYRTLSKKHTLNDVQVLNEINGEHQYKIIIDVREFMQGSLKTSVIGERELLVEGSIEETKFGVRGKRTFEKRFLVPSEAILSDTTSALSSDGILTIISPKKIIDDSLPIYRKGKYFSDTSFKDVHGDFNMAIQDVLKRWNETSEDDLESYRNLRRRTLREDNQAITEKENHQIYKIVIDVHDFVTDGEVIVKVVNDRYLEVEGCIDVEEEETKSKKSFKRRFILPKSTDIENISSLLSSDGVLTITSPKKGGDIDFKETIIPIKLQKLLKKESSDSTLKTETDNHFTANESSSELKSNAESEISNEIKKDVNDEVIIPVTLEGNNDDMEHQDLKTEENSANNESGISHDNVKHINCIN